MSRSFSKRTVHGYHTSTLPGSTDTRVGVFYTLLYSIIKPFKVVTINVARKNYT